MILLYVVFIVLFGVCVCVLSCMQHSGVFTWGGEGVSFIVVGEVVKPYCYRNMGVL